MAGSAFGVIFDCDGTLIDSMGAWRELEADLARRVGAELDKEDTDALTTMSIPECGAYLHGKFGLGESPEEVVGTIDDFMMDYYANRSVARPGALRFVRGLADAGVPMAVASSTPSALLRAGIEHAGFAPYMRAIVSVDDVGKSKREPAVYDRAREALGTTRAQTWGFEDATYALRTLNAAGYHTFGVYDCDLSGTFEELAGEADMVARSFEAVSAADFLKAANPHVRVVYKPVAKAGAAAAAGGAGVACGGRTQGDPFLRAENEDDDGYDPYSDRREETPLFEASPWD